MQINAPRPMVTVTVALVSPASQPEWLGHRGAFVTPLAGLTTCRGVVKDSESEVTPSRLSYLVAKLDVKKIKNKKKRSRLAPTYL